MRSSDEATLEKLPTVVQYVVGDIGDPTTLQKAVEGVNKIICCTRATSMLSGDLTRVEQQGVANLAKAFLVCTLNRLSWTVLCRKCSRYSRRESVQKDY